MLDSLRIRFLQYWRLLNTSAIVVGMILPWRLVYSDVVPSSGASPVYGWWELEDSFRSLSRIENYAPPFFSYRLDDIAMLIGAGCLMLYISGNLCQLILRTTHTSERWALFLRVTGVASILILSNDFISPMMNSRLFVGYYITALTIVGSILLEGNNNMNLNTKYPYLTAWVGLIALNALVGLFLAFVPSELLWLLLQVIVGFFIFRFVVKRNILPHIRAQDAKIISPEPR